MDIVTFWYLIDMWDGVGLGPSVDVSHLLIYYYKGGKAQYGGIPIIKYNILFSVIFNYFFLKTGSSLIMLDIYFITNDLEPYFI